MRTIDELRRQDEIRVRRGDLIAAVLKVLAGFHGNPVMTSPPFPPEEIDAAAAALVDTMRS